METSIEDIFDEIQQYGKEIGISNLSIESLIKSHRSLREKSLIAQDHYLEFLKEFVDKVRQEVLDSESIKIDELRKMSVEELINLLRTD